MAGPFQQPYHYAYFSDEATRESPGGWTHYSVPKRNPTGGVSGEYDHISENNRTGERIYRGSGDGNHPHPEHRNQWGFE